MSLDANKKVALEFIRTLGSREVEKWHSLMDPNLEWSILGNLGFSGRKNRKEFEGAVQMLWDTIDGPCTINISHITAEENRVAMTGEGDMKTKAGRVYNNTYNFLLWIENGKVIRGREYFDTQLVAEVFV